MVELVLTVKGLMALWGEEIEAARICLRNDPPKGTEACIEGEKHLSRAENYRMKAYDLMGVNTIEPSSQTSFFDTL